MRSRVLRCVTAMLLMIVLPVLSSCTAPAPRQGMHIVNVFGEEFFVDTEHHEILAGTHIYRYTRDQGGERIMLTFPDGGQVEIVRQGGTIMTSDFRTSNHSYEFVSDFALTAALDSVYGRPSGAAGGGAFGSVAVGVILIAYGILSVASPKFAWKINYGWKFKDAEPSDGILIANRILGAIMAVIGVVMVFVGVAS